MRREFRPWFAVVNEGYHQGSSGGGTNPDWADPDDSYCGEDGWIYTFIDEDSADLVTTGYVGPAWYRYKDGFDFDPGWHSNTPPAGTPRC